MKFSLVPLLLTGKTISAAARQALREKRFHDAAAIIMEEYGLSCDEANDLLSIAACS
jgi:AmiR/NasT family two-component response regulator